MKRKIQVFVSGTFTDLISERQAAVAAILKAGHIPAGMELFTAGDKSQWVTIQRWIDESDAYMLILGGRYGSIEPISGVSYTELEYDYALQQNKPSFAVVIDEQYLEQKVKSCGTGVIERENVQELRLFRQKVLSNISSFFSDDKDIRLCIHESLADLNSNSAVKGWISAADVENTKPLHDEISHLRSENTRLQQSLAKTPSALPKSEAKITSESYDEITNILKATIIKTPKDILNLQESIKDSYTLLEIFFIYRDTLITGVTNRFGIGNIESFLYYNIAPKLKVHNLIDNEKVSGGVRRSFVNTKGISFLAEIQHRVNSNKVVKSKSIDNAVGDSSPSKPLRKTAKTSKNHQQEFPEENQ